MSYEDFLKRAKNRSEVLSGLPDSPFVEGTGNIKAPVVVVGYRPGSGYTEPFRSPHTEIVRDMLVTALLPADMYFMTTMIKRDSEGNVWSQEQLREWGLLTLEEIDAIGARHVILLGAKVAWAMLNLEEHKVDLLRHTRFVMSGRSHITFFVTYPPEYIYAEGGIMSPPGRLWLLDIAGAFKAQDYFPLVTPVDKTKTIG